MAKKKKTFIPPFGTAITEQSFRDKIMERENEKSEKSQATKVSQQSKATQKPSSNEQEKSKIKKKKFSTPLSQSQSQLEKTDNQGRIENMNGSKTPWKGKSNP